MDAQKKKQIYNFLVFTLIFAGVLVRFFKLGVVPRGINADEAFAGYEAFSLLNYGIDSSGYHNPVYFVSWGSGMNVLNSYLMIPFIKLFGLQLWAIRIPQALMASLSLPCFYLLLKKVFNEEVGLIGLFLLTISPWHIMLSRWGLESNMAPAFLLFGLYFFILGIEKPNFYILSALAYGLSLYCYATIWTIVPFIILAQLLYLFFSKKLKPCWQLLLSGFLLFLLALPLLLFLAINMGYMNEIRTPFFSIPKLVAMRSTEISLREIPNNFYILYNLITSQYDGLPWNASDQFGLYYKFSTPFIAFGMVYLVKQILLKWKEKEFTLAVFPIIQLLAAVILGCLIINANENKINCIHLSIITCIALGIYYICQLLHHEFTYPILLIYVVSFIAFHGYYYNGYEHEKPSSFSKDSYAAIQCAMEQDKPICITENISYAILLFSSRQPTDEYVATVEYFNYPSGFLKVKSFGRFQFGYDTNNLESDYTYIIHCEEVNSFHEQGYHTVEFENYAVAYK